MWRRRSCTCSSLSFPLLALLALLTSKWHLKIEWEWGRIPSANPAEINLMSNFYHCRADTRNREYQLEGSSGDFWLRTCIKNSAIRLNFFYSRNEWAEANECNSAGPRGERLIVVSLMDKPKCRRPKSNWFLPSFIIDWAPADQQTQVGSFQGLGVLFSILKCSRRRRKLCRHSFKFFSHQRCLEYLIRSRKTNIRVADTWGREFARCQNERN